MNESYLNAQLQIMVLLQECKQDRQISPIALSYNKDIFKIDIYLHSRGRATGCLESNAEAEYFEALLAADAEKREVLAWGSSGRL